MNQISAIHKIDLHMHTVISDGTDTPEEIIPKIEEHGIDLFAVTDHDSIKGCDLVKKNLTAESPLFISGVEFSCKDDFGKYHILGYGYDSSAEVIRSFVNKGHAIRITKMEQRLHSLKELFGISFSNEDISWLYSQNNPGKPHLADLMVKNGLADSLHQAFLRYINKMNVSVAYFHPEDAINVILQSGGIPVLAHPSYGSGEELIRGADMEKRILRLMSMGIKGMEAFYSGFSPVLQQEILDLAEKYDLYVTAGSDYHGTHKELLLPGDNYLEDVKQAPHGLLRFLEDVPLR